MTATGEHTQHEADRANTEASRNLTTKLDHSLNSYTLPGKTRNPLVIFATSVSCAPITRQRVPRLCETSM